MIRTLLTIVLFAAGSGAVAQTNVDLGSLTVDPAAGVEVSADTLSVDQDTGRAVFAGNVVIAQDALRMTADEVTVVYGEDTSDITRLTATGGVTVATADEAAEAQQADYDIAAGLLTLTGDVLLTQGASAIAAQNMTINVTDGTATMGGRVRTVLQQGEN